MGICLLFLVSRGSVCPTVEHGMLNGLSPQALAFNTKILKEVPRKNMSTIKIEHIQMFMWSQMSSIHPSFGSNPHWTSCLCGLFSTFAQVHCGPQFVRYQKCICTCSLRPSCLVPCYHAPKKRGVVDGYETDISDWRIGIILSRSTLSSHRWSERFKVGYLRYRDSSDPM